MPKSHILGWHILIPFPGKTTSNWTFQKTRCLCSPSDPAPFYCHFIVGQVGRVPHVSLSWASSWASVSSRGWRLALWVPPQLWGCILSSHHGPLLVSPDSVLLSALSFWDTAVRVAFISFKTSRSSFPLTVFLSGSYFVWIYWLCTYYKHW